MNQKIRDILLIPLCLTMLVLTTAGFRACSAAEKRTVAQNVTSGLRIAARAVEPGIETVRAFREAGKVEASTSLALAEGALQANAAAKSLAQAALDGADAPTLAGQLETVVNLAGDLERSGVLRLKNGETKLVFQLGVIAAKNGLVIARDELKGTGGVPVTFTLDEVTRKSLLDLMPVFERNDALLRESVRRLKAP